MRYNSLLQVTTSFANQSDCIDFLTKMRWPDDNVVCPMCKHNKVYTLKGANKRYKCASCRKQFSAVKGTIFENSPIPLQKWFIAIYLHTSHKKGISSHQLAKDIELTQKTAWFMLQRIRFALESGTFEPNDEALYEIDETYVGGKEKNKHQSAFVKRQKAELKRQNDKVGIPNVATTGRSSTKVPVVGIVQRDGNVTAKVMKDVTAKSLYPFIKENVMVGATIVTDEFNVYDKLRIDFTHETVCHKQGEYVRGHFHTNSIENFWSQMKRGIIGIYHHCSPKHLDKYVDEFEFRFNTRKMNEAQRFEKCVSLTSRRLTYAALIADNGKESKPILTD